MLSACFSTGPSTWNQSSTLLKTKADNATFERKLKHLNFRLPTWTVSNNRNKSLVILFFQANIVLEHRSFEVGHKRLCIITSDCALDTLWYCCIFSGCLWKYLAIRSLIFVHVDAARAPPVLPRRCYQELLHVANNQSGCFYGRWSYVWFYVLQISSEDMFE